MLMTLAARGCCSHYMETLSIKHDCQGVRASNDSTDSSDAEAMEHFSPTYHATAPLCLEAVIKDIITQNSLGSTFYVLDLAVLRQLHKAWKDAMPRVQV